MRNRQSAFWLLALNLSFPNALCSQALPVARWQASSGHQEIWAAVLQGVHAQPLPAFLHDSFPGAPIILLTLRDAPLQPFATPWLDSLVQRGLAAGLCPQETGAACAGPNPAIFVRLGDPVLLGQDSAVVRVVREIGHPFPCPLPSRAKPGMYAQETLTTLTRQDANWQVVRWATLAPKALICTP